MTNDKSNQERAKEYDQIITMQKILLQTIFRNGVFISGKPITLELNESQRVSLNRVGVKVEKRQPTKFNVGDRVVVHDYPSPIPSRQFWVITDVHSNNGTVSYRLFSEQHDILDYIRDEYLSPYVEPERVPIFHDDPFTNGDIVQIVKPRDHSEATGMPWIVTGRFSDNTATISRFGVEPWLPANDKTVPVEILAKFPEPKYSDGQKVDIDDGGNMIPCIVKASHLTQYGAWIYNLQSVNSENHFFNRVEESDMSPTPEPAAPKFQGGDTVQVKRRNGHWTVALVVAPNSAMGRTEFEYDVRIDLGLVIGDASTEYRLTVPESDLELVEPTPVSFQFEVGDYVRIKATGERRNIARDAGGDWWVLNGDQRYPTSQLEFISRPEALQGAFYDTEEPALFDPELVMTRAQRDGLMDCLYGNSMDDYEPEITVDRIKELFPKPE